VLLGIAGIGLIAYALFGMVTTNGDNLGRQAVFMLAAVLAHDFVVIPLAIVGGALASRVVPGWARAPVHAALLTTLALTVVAIPFMVKSGTFPDNPSLLPLNYRRGLLITIGVVWLVALSTALWRRPRQRPP
jgi:hypothetical protein